MSSSAVVVGAGVFGASIAHRLVRDGWQVTLVERDEPASERATSASHSRIIRSGHGNDAWHALLARRARELWREIEQETGTELLVECGLLWMARADGRWESQSENVLRAHGIPVERLDAAQMASLFPSFEPDGLAFGLFEPEAGMLRARRAVQTLVELARDGGAELVHADARPAFGGVDLGEDLVLEADRVIWACGPWLATLFPGLVEIQSQRVEYATFACGADWSATRGVPAYVEVDAELYGLPDLDAQGFKVAPEPPPTPLDPDTLDRPLSAATEHEARAYLRRRFPALADAPRTGGRVCQYEMTPDGEFVLAEHPDHPGVWLAGGGSGHGFKHGPALAEVVRDLLTGAAEPLDRHSLAPRVQREGMLFGPAS